MPFDANGRWVPEDQSSVTQLNKMLASDSDYITLARKSGEQAANRRGLINSTIAGGAAQREAIAAAAPFAQQDAAQLAAQNLSKQDAGQTSDLASQQAAAALRAQQEAASSASRLSSQEAEQQLKYGTTITGMQSTSAADLARMNNDAEAQRVAAQLDADLKKTGMTLSAQDKANTVNALLAADQNYNNTFASIAANENIPAATRDAYLQNLVNVRQSGIDAVQKVYGISLSWGGETAKPVTPEPPPPAAVTPTPAFDASNFSYNGLF